MNACRTVLRFVSCSVTAIVLVIAGCSTAPPMSRHWHDSDQSRGDTALEAGINVCSAAYTQAFERAKDDFPADPAPGPSGSAMAMQAAASVTVWRSIANDAFNSCMRSNR